MDPTVQVEEHDAIVIGAGISGLAAAKCLKDDGFDVIMLERSCDVGGLWNFRENDYGVMSFTHINVSKYNYSFSDFPFPDSIPDFPHHSDMAQYIRNYATHFRLLELVRYNIKVLNIEETGEKWRITACRTGADGKTETDVRLVFVCNHVAVSTGHHAKPSYPVFPGQDTFPGEILHSVDYNDAVINKFEGQRVLVVGIGNSAVDAAVDCVQNGRCPPVTLSTRSGAWVMPNYLMGAPTDLYATRFFFLLPRGLQNWVFETVISVITGSPWKWGLNPKMGALQTQPTVSPSLIHHIQRRNIHIQPNITKIEGKTVHFINGNSADFDKILYCTGYRIDLPFLPDSVKSKVFKESSNELQLYKNVFSPNVGHNLAFIGFVQPASGGVLSMSEMQARWFSALCKGEATLPFASEMEEDIQKEKNEQSSRWYQSDRHTMQKDPIIYCDEIAEVIQAKPDPVSQPMLAFRLLFSSCGTAQYRLTGPHSWGGAAGQVRKVPLTGMWAAAGYVIVAVIAWVVYYVMSSILSIF